VLLVLKEIDSCAIFLFQQCMFVLLCVGLLERNGGPWAKYNLGTLPPPPLLISL